MVRNNVLLLILEVSETDKSVAPVGQRTLAVKGNSEINIRRAGNPEFLHFSCSEHQLIVGIHNLFRAVTLDDTQSVVTFADKGTNRCKRLGNAFLSVLFGCRNRFEQLLMLASFAVVNNKKCHELVKCAPCTTVKNKQYYGNCTDHTARKDRKSVV